MRGLKAALENLSGADCRTAYVDGSFVTHKAIPNDYDACWEETGVDPVILDPRLLIFDLGRAAQKARRDMGELFPASVADADGLSFLEFFQTDRESQRVAMDLGDLA